jgi:hypothetical protein
VPIVYEFVERTTHAQNFIVMQLLGKNLANKKKSLGKKFTQNIAIDYLVSLSRFPFFLTKKFISRFKSLMRSKRFTTEGLFTETSSL